MTAQPEPQPLDEGERRALIGRIARYIAAKGLEECGLILSVDLQRNATIRLFVGGVMGSTLNNIPHSIVRRPKSWSLLDGKAV